MSGPPLPSNDARHWQDRAFPRVLVQLLTSTVGPMIVGILAAIIPALLVAAVTKNTSGGNWADHIAEMPFSRQQKGRILPFPL